jgi:phospholipase/carboxylesterase
VDPKRRYLLGFSQGGYFAGYIGIKEAHRLAGLVIMGARVKSEVLGRELERARDLPVLLLHGKKDRAVPFASAVRSGEALTDAGLPTELRSYDCGHHVTPDQVRDVRDWLKRRISARS